LPKWYLAKPEILLGEEVYFEAFWHLRTEAQQGDSTLGRIPWSKAIQYGAGLFCPEFVDPFWRIIYALDTAYLEWQRAEYDRNIRQKKPAKAPSKGGTRTRAPRR